jgi:hypothetical protein
MSLKTKIQTLPQLKKIKAAVPLIVKIDAPENSEEHSTIIRKARRDNLKRLQSIQNALITRLENEMDGIKPRELLYNLDIANKVSYAMLDRDVPTPQSQVGAQVIVNGLSRDEALALLQGHRDPKKHVGG